MFTDLRGARVDCVVRLSRLSNSAIELHYLVKLECWNHMLRPALASTFSRNQVPERTSATTELPARWSVCFSYYRARGAMQVADQEKTSE